jgi:hypothetical protein
MEIENTATSFPIYTNQVSMLELYIFLHKNKVAIHHHNPHLLQSKIEYSIKRIAKATVKK